MKKLRLSFTATHETHFERSGIWCPQSGSAGNCGDDSYPFFCLNNTAVDSVITDEHKESCRAAAYKGKAALANWISENCFGVGRAAGMEDQPLHEISGYRDY